MQESTYPWFGAEGKRGSALLIVRGRKLPPGIIGSSGLPTLFVVTYQYDCHDQTGLPTDEQYAEIDRFEMRTLEVIEAKRQGLAVLILTSNGYIQYFYYVKDAELIKDTISMTLLDNDPVELSAVADPDWSEYKELLSHIDCQPQ